MVMMNFIKNPAAAAAASQPIRFNVQVIKAHLYNRIIFKQTCRFLKQQFVQSQQQQRTPTKKREEAGRVTWNSN